MRNVSVYAKPHGSGNEGGKRGTANYNITKVINNITNVNNTNIPQDLNVRSIRADKADFGDLNATSIYVTNGNITYLIASDGTINKLKGNEIEYTLGNIADLFTDNTTTNKLTVEDTATIQKLISQYIQSTNITTDYLTVNKSAHFFELIVDKLRSTKGTEIQTAANCVIDFVEAYNSNDQKIDPTSGSVKYYKVYWRNRDADGKKMENDWLEYDQALCETYNITQGTSYHTRNKYYWRLVEDTDNGTPAYINFDKQEVWSKSGTPNSTIEFGDIYFEHNDGVTIDINNFDVYAEESGTYDPSTYKWNPTSTLYGLVIEPFEMINGEKVRISLSDGYFCFETFDYSKISITFYYDDGTIKYIKEPNAYNLEYINGINANLGVNKIVLHTAIIDKWDECNWIRLSNTVRDSLKAGKSPVPDVGDNLAQLGYRYQMLPDYEDTDEWYEEHPDEVGRASAIITSAYATPDNGGTYEGKTYPPIKPPSFVQYGKITDFRLFTHRLNVVSHGFNSFRGDFRTMAGDELATHSELIQTADEIRLEVTEQIENIKFEKVETIDATSLDPSKCYPVTINFNQSNDSKQIRCAVSRTLIQTYGVPNYSTHTRGFVIDLDWTTRASGWGTNWVERRWYVGDKTRFIQEFELHYTNQTDKVVGSIGQVTEASIEVVYVRGGSKYDILTSFKDATITLHPTGYVWGNQEYSVRDERPVINYEDLVVPVKDRMGRSEIIQTAENIQLNVYDELNRKTGIDVSTGKITLNADNTTIVGNLDITDSENGITVYETLKDDSLTPRVNIQPYSINELDVSEDKILNYSTYNEGASNTLYANFNYYPNKSFEKYQEINFGIKTLDLYYYSPQNTNIFKPAEESELILHVYIYPNSQSRPTSPTADLTITKASDSGQYMCNNVVKYIVYSQGYYDVYCEVESNTTPPSTSGSETCFRRGNIDMFVSYSKAGSNQTIIGKDGFMSHPGAHSVLLNTENKTIIQHNDYGLNINNDGIYINAGLYEENGVQQPNWIPFNNYNKMYEIEEFESGRVGDLWCLVAYDSGAHYTLFYGTASKYSKQYSSIGYSNRPVYFISPNVFNGIIRIHDVRIINNPSYRYIVLPPSNYYDNQGILRKLPKGYNFKIINDVRGGYTSICTFQRNKEDYIYDSSLGYITPQILVYHNKASTVLDCENVVSSIICTYGGKIDWDLGNSSTSIIRNVDVWYLEISD